MFLEEKRKKELSEANARERATDTEVNSHSSRELYLLKTDYSTIADVVVVVCLFVCLLVIARCTP